MLAETPQILIKEKENCVCLRHMDGEQLFFSNGNGTSLSPRKKTRRRCRDTKYTSLFYEGSKRSRQEFRRGREEIARRVSRRLKKGNNRRTPSIQGKESSGIKLESRSRRITGEESPRGGAERTHAWRGKRVFLDRLKGWPKKLNNVMVRTIGGNQRAMKTLLGSAQEEGGTVKGAIPRRKKRGNPAAPKSFSICWKREVLGRLLIWKGCMVEQRKMG